MRPVSRPPAFLSRLRVGPSAAPAPRARSARAERLRWRLSRLWRSRAVRRAALVQAPALALALVGAALVRDPAAHRWVGERIDAAAAALAAQPRFAIREITVDGASPPLEAEIRAALSEAMGRSSLSIRADRLRDRLLALSRVRKADVALQAPARLSLRIEERLPAALLRAPDGTLRLIDLEGQALAPATRRADHPGLPVLTGEGAARAVPEALGVIAAAGPLAPRLRGLIRVGARRWDVALSQDMRVLLPASDPVPAMRRAAEWQRSRKLFNRDLAHVDLRLPDRPFLRLRPRAVPAFVAARPELRSPES